MELRYLYVGSSDTGADVAAWLRLPGISLAWRFRHFGADVAAVDTGGSPTVLRSPGGTEIAVLQVDRPQAMERAWTDEGNTRRVRG